MATSGMWKEETGTWKKKSTLNCSNVWFQASHLADDIKKSLSPLGGKEESPRRGQDYSLPHFHAGFLCCGHLAHGHYHKLSVSPRKRTQQLSALCVGGCSISGFWLRNTAERASLHTIGVTGSHVPPYTNHITHERHCFLQTGYFRKTELNFCYHPATQYPIRYQQVQIGRIDCSVVLIL